MKKLHDWLSQPITVPRFNYLIFVLFFWMTMGQQLWDYFTVGRPLHQCLEHHQAYCQVNGVSYFVEYKS